MDSKQHPLFLRYPLAGQAALSTGVVPTPYHIYNGDGLLIGGSVDAAAACTLLANEQVHPLLSAEGRAAAGIWVCNFTDASLGPHHELQISLFVTTGNDPPLPEHPLALAAAMLTRPNLLMLCFRLWNNTAPVVAYNRERLGLNARLAVSTIRRQQGQVAFEVEEQVGLVLSGRLADPPFGSARAGFDLARLVGLRAMFQAARRPWMTMRVVNPVGPKFNRNLSALAFASSDRVDLRYFDAGSDTLIFGEAACPSLQFRPMFVESMRGFKFVYLDPQPIDE